MTTTGRTTRCSSNRPMAAGSASRTLVSRTYVRRTEELATRSLPWAPGGAVFGHIGLARAEAPVQETCRQDRDRPAEGRAPALRSSRLRARTRSSRISRAFPSGGYAPPVTPDVTLGQ